MANVPEPAGSAPPTTETPEDDLGGLPLPDQRALGAARSLAQVLDEAIELPIIGRVGLDGLIGFIPVLGDIAGAALSSLVVAMAARARAPGAVLFRMMLNILIDLALGAVPIIGDLFDLVWRANRRNADLLEATLRSPERARRASFTWVFWLMCALAAICGGLLYGMYWALATVLGIAL